jgi:hypothetical protein
VVGWRAHSVRGFISTADNKGIRIESSKNESGERIYHKPRVGPKGLRQGRRREPQRDDLLWFLFAQDTAHPMEGKPPFLSMSCPISLAGFQLRNRLQQA